MHSLEQFKSAKIHKFFVAPADQNYLLARWMLGHGIYPEFFWQASQCIEKYLKAALAINGRDVGNYNHKILKLFETFGDAYPQHTLDDFVKPSEIHDHDWLGGTARAFIRRIETYGSPDSRYGLHSWHREPDDLFKLDQLAFSLRRATICFEWRIGQYWPAGPQDQAWIGQTYNDILLKNRDWQPRGKFGKLDHPTDRMGREFGDVLYRWNLSFRRHDADWKAHAPELVAPVMEPFENSEIFLLMEQLNSPEARRDQILKEGVNWLIHNVRMPAKVRNEFEASLDRLNQND